MQVLGLAGMAAAWRELAEQSSANELSRDEWLGLMLDREVAMRADKRVRNRLASAKLRFPEACIEDIDFAAPRGLDRRNTMALAQGEWLKAHENLIVTGQTGTGKSWLACAFSEIAVRELAEPLSGFCEMRNPNKNGHGQQAAAAAGYILMYSLAKREEKALFCCWATTKMHPVNVAPFWGAPLLGSREPRGLRARRANGKRI
nr:ATP-binding protein [Mesorhizobium sp.]